MYIGAYLISQKTNGRSSTSFLMPRTQDSRLVTAKGAWKALAKTSSKRSSRGPLTARTSGSTGSTDAQVPGNPPSAKASPSTALPMIFLEQASFARETSVTGVISVSSSLPWLSVWLSTIQRLGTLCSTSLGPLRMLGASHSRFNWRTSWSGHSSPAGYLLSS